MCEHIYKEIKADICPLCNKPTHTIDWKLITKQHKEWTTSGKAVAQGWWSI